MQPEKRNSSVRKSLVFGVILCPLIVLFFLILLAPKYLGVFFQADSRYQPMGRVLFIIAILLYITVVILSGKVVKFISQYYFHSLVEKRALGRFMLILFLIIGNIPLLLIALGPAILLVSALPSGFK
jgi:hypothetical protein